MTRVKSGRRILAMVQVRTMDTRSRILETAWALVRERGMSGVTLADVASAAGVSRQLLYFHFGNRAGLLVEMTRHHDGASGFIRRVVATRSLEPVPGLEQFLREWFAYIPEILPLARALEAAAIKGEEGGAAWFDRMGDLRQAFRIAVDRVALEGRLAEGWTVERATDWIWALSHPGVYQQLVEESGWQAEELVERSIRSFLSEVVAGVTDEGGLS